MGAWIPVPGGTRCGRHEVVFQKGGACPHCYSDPPPPDADEDRDPPFDRAAAASMPTTLDHERAFTRMADLAEEWAVEEEKAAAHWIPHPDGESGSMKEGPSRSVAAKLLDTAIKARRAAHACARQREDWENTERLEEMARSLEARH